MRAIRLFLVGCALALAGLVPLLPAGDAPKAEKETGLDALAAKVVTQNARVREGELVQISGDVKDAELLEDLALQVRKLGAHPLITLASDRLWRRYYDDVPPKFDSDVPALELKLAGLIDCEIVVESQDDATIAGVPGERLAAQQKAWTPVVETILKRNVRYLTIGNGLYPTPSRAKQCGLSEAELRTLFEAGLDVDYAQLQAAGEKLKKVLSGGKEMRLTNPNGTDLKAGIDKRPVIVRDGVVSDEKRKQGGAACWAFLPSGEVVVMMEPGTAEGRVVVGRLLYGGKEINDVTVTVKGGKVISLHAKAGDEQLQAEYKAAPEGKDRCGVIDVGINPNLRLPANGKVQTPAAAGAITVTVGDDSWAGGGNVCEFSLAGDLPGSTLSVDGRVVAEKGELKP